MAIKSITKYQLGVLFSEATANFKDLDQSDLDTQQFVALCWAKAVNSYLAPELEFEFPIRKPYQPVDED